MCVFHKKTRATFTIQLVFFIHEKIIGYLKLFFFLIKWRYLKHMFFVWSFFYQWIQQFSVFIATTHPSCTLADVVPTVHTLCPLLPIDYYLCMLLIHSGWHRSSKKPCCAPIRANLGGSKYNKIVSSNIWKFVTFYIERLMLIKRLQNVPCS